MSRAVAHLLAVGALVVAGPAPAVAGTAALISEVEADDQEIVYKVVSESAAGERNALTIRVGEPRQELVRSVLLHDSGAPLVALAPCRAVDPHTVACTAPTEETIEAVRVELGDSDDRLETVSAPQATYDFLANGGPGNDTLTAAGVFTTLLGGEGDDVLRVSQVLDGSLDGGPGDDELWAGTTSAQLNGGGGRDAMHGSGVMRDGDQEGAVGDAAPGPDLFDAIPRPHTDWEFQAYDTGVSYDTRRAPIRVDLRRGVGGAAGEGDVLRGVRNVFGGRGDDRLLGDGEPNVLIGGPGFDRLSGRGGDDWLEPERGGSRLFCGAGSDTAGGRTSSKDRLASDCESLGGTPTDFVDRRPARPTLTAAGRLRHRVRCPEFSDKCSAWLHVSQAGGRHRLLARGGIPLGRWHKRAIALTLTGAGRRLAARRRTVTATLKLHMQEDGYAFTRRWTTRVALRR